MTGLPAGSPEKCISFIEKLFTVSKKDIDAIIANFHAEMSKGLSGNESSLKMLPSFVDVPKGDEEGEFIVIDLGGTNLRVFAVELRGDKNSTISAVSRFVIPEKNMHDTEELLFGFIADCVASFVAEHNIKRKNLHGLAFTFSFPVEQTGITSGRLVTWTKGFAINGVEGEDVAMLLNEALKGRGIDRMEVAVLVNDTVGTMVAGSYGHPDCDVGVVIGTGTNACYREKISNIARLKKPSAEGYMIVNTEWGNFDRLDATNYDTKLDENSINPGAMRFEKMVSGMYLGEITRLVLVDFIRDGLIFSGKSDVARVFSRKDTLKAEHMSLIEGDETANLDTIESFLMGRGIKYTSFSDRMLLKRLCGSVSTRSARLCAAAVSAVVTWMDPGLERTHTVAVDGSLFEKYTGFETKMTDVFEEMYGEKSKRIKPIRSKDGSGRGAAVIASMVARSESKERA